LIGKHDHEPRKHNHASRRRRAMRNETVRSPRPDDDDPLEPVRTAPGPEEDDEVIDDDVDEDAAVPHR
jgi:hypothetical protein